MVAGVVLSPNIGDFLLAVMVDSWTGVIDGVVILLHTGYFARTWVVSGVVFLLENVEMGVVTSSCSIIDCADGVLVEGPLEVVT